jgi:hypothetical protein
MMALSWPDHAADRLLETFAMIGKRKSSTDGHEKRRDDGNEDMQTTPDLPRQSGAPPGKQSPKRRAAAVPQQQEWLRRSLKKLYEDTVQDPIPDSFVELLEELDRKEREGK